MNNPRIVIDAGHGGTDGGASGNGIIEKNLTLDISQYMYKKYRRKNSFEITNLWESLW